MRTARSSRLRDLADAWPDREWVDRVRTGDRRAFEILFKTFYGRLCRFATRYVGGRDRAENVVQDVFVTLWERRKRWRLRTSLRSYLYRAVRNRALNDARDRRFGGEPVLPYPDHLVAGDPSAEDRLHDEDLARSIWAAIDALPDRRRTAFVLHRQHGLSYAEVAEVMGLAEKTVENHIGHALKFLRAALAERR